MSVRGPLSAGGIRGPRLGASEPFYRASNLEHRLDDHLSPGEPVVGFDFRQKDLRRPSPHLVLRVDDTGEENLGDSGELLYLPYEQSIHSVYCSEKIFDDAGVPRPKAPRTWDDCVETTGKLTDREKGIYGSYFVNWPCYYMLARQRDIPAYKSDGTADANLEELLDCMK